MILERIQDPTDVRALGRAELDELAAEIRQFVIEAVARTGGHLGSNLGIVELTLALHRVFDSPRDALLWDTGHQAYVHKLLTGRRDAFETLRQAGGLSGYPSRAESPHDIIENSHASTALAWAFGIARGWQGRGGDEDRRVVAVVGDGALTGGMAYEALNNVGHAELPLVVVLNDNGRSYAETVSRLSDEVSRVRFDPRYRRWRSRWNQLAGSVPLGERLTEAWWEAVKTAVSGAPNLQHFVEALGLRYAGPFDGHDVLRLERELRRAARQSGPVLVHVLTHKGLGYEPAETDPEKKLHDTSAFDVATGRSQKAKPRSWTQAFSETLCELADENPDVVALTAAMPGSTGLLPLAERHPDRVLDVGIAEQHAVTSAAGLSRAGRIPVLAVYSTFFSRAFDQTNLDVGLHDEHVVFVFDRSGITGPDGPSHHGVLDLALTLRIPTMTVLVPSCEEEVAVMLRDAVGLPGPVSLRFPKGGAVSLGAAGEGLAARQVRAGGEDLCLLGVGDRLQPALEAADALAGEDGLSVSVWDPRVIRPVDPELLEAAARSPLVVTVENGVVSGGAGSYIAEKLVERTGVGEAPPVLRLGVPEAYVPQGKPDQILTELGLDGPGITAAVRKVLDLA